MGNRKTALCFFKEDTVMPEARLSVRVDENIKRRAEKVFHDLGLTLSSGISLYLSQVATQNGIPFPLTQNQQGWCSSIDLIKQIEELKAQMAVESKIKEMLRHGVAVALFDEQLNRPYLQYPDGRREYDINI